MNSEDGLLVRPLPGRYKRAKFVVHLQYVYTRSTGRSWLCELGVEKLVNLVTKRSVEARVFVVTTHPGLELQEIKRSE